MEKENFIIVTDQKTITSVIVEAIRQAGQSKKDDFTSEFEKDRISKPEAAKLVGISLPTMDRQIKLGKFKQYNVGHRKFFLRSELIEALKNNY